MTQETVGIVRRTAESSVPNRHEPATGSVRCRSECGDPELRICIIRPALSARIDFSSRALIAINRCSAGVFSNLLLLPLLLVSALANGAILDETVNTVEGQIHGVREGTVVVYKGIPYAVPPVGALRWRAPVPHPPWQGVRSAAEYGPPCIQTAKMGEAYAPIIGSEDCLTLNIWSPREQHRELPVMVWIHGGYSNWGSSSVMAYGVRLYDGHYMAEHGSVIVVTLNYRLGPFGFLAHPALSAETPYHGSGNYGYMDIIEALHWIRRNIRRFGGDAGNVTIFGESAGGTAVGALVCSPLARGLFQRAIQQSPSYVKRTLHEAEAYGLQLGNALGCRGRDAASCMRERPAPMLFTSLPRALESGGNYYKFDVDGYVLTEPIMRAFSAGRQTTVPMIAGVTSQETGNLLRYYGANVAGMSTQSGARDAATTYLQNGLRMSSDEASRLLSSCPTAHKTPKEWAIACTSIPSRCTNMRFTLVAAKRAPVYRYIYAHTFSSGPLGEIGPGHGAELPFVFHNFPVEARYGSPTESELALSDTIIGYWTHFAETGDPNHLGAPAVWPDLRRYSSSSSYPYLRLDTTSKVEYTSGDECRILAIARAPANQRPAKQNGSSH